MNLNYVLEKKYRWLSISPLGTLIVPLNRRGEVDERLDRSFDSRERAISALSKIVNTGNVSVGNRYVLAEEHSVGIDWNA